jgi:lipoyl(octanoyl) transferase
MRPAPGSPPVEWVVSPGLVDYPAALAEMEARAEQIAEGRAAERVWLVEHPPLYTAGTSAKEADLLDARFPVFRAGRGGQFTYHGPGQRVAYAMLDLDVVGETRESRVGVWVARPDKPAGIDGSPAEDKIAAIGIRVRRWVSFHGVSLNVAPDLAHFQGIVPCGIGEAHYGVTSLRDLGRAASMAQADAALRNAFEARFGPVEPRGPDA